MHTIYTPAARNEVERQYHAQRLQTAITDSGLTQEQFATLILSRDESTIRRWLNTNSPMPKAITRWLDHWYTLSTGTRRRIIGALVPKPDTRNSLEDQ